MKANMGGFYYRDGIQISHFGGTNSAFKGKPKWIKECKKDSK